MNTEAERPNPYVGLRPFDRGDSLYFFGRRGQVAPVSWPWSAAPAAASPP
jgi:hypothetical protein